MASIGVVLNRAIENRFNNNIPPNVQVALGSLPIRSYTASDYGPLDEWMKSLANFYDGHSDDNKLLDQLVGAENADPKGFFTKKKALLVSYDPLKGNPTGALCLNYKRGGAVKIGPVVVDAELRGRGIGKTLFQTADLFAASVGARKLFATTSHLNTPVNTLFNRYGFEVEAIFPDQYKKGSNELIWGKFTAGHPVMPAKKIRSVVQSTAHTKVAAKVYDQYDRQYVNQINALYSAWHDDLGEDFIDGMVAGQDRGLSFQDKGKLILIGKTASDSIVGMLTFTPKRGGPVKIYPIAGSSEAQTALLDRSTEIATSLGNHKLYTFAHIDDKPQQDVLTANGFTQRGILKSPYKDGHDLLAFDKMIK